MVENELSKSLTHFGYRKMAERLNLKYGLNISRESVRKVLCEIDEECVSMRRKKNLPTKWLLHLVIYFI